MLKQRSTATERKRSEFSRYVLVDYSRIMSGIGTLGCEDKGRLERMDNCLARIEKPLAAMIAANGR